MIQMLEIIAVAYRDGNTDHRAADHLRLAAFEQRFEFFVHHRPDMALAVIRQNTLITCEHGIKTALMILCKDVLKRIFKGLGFIPGSCRKMRAAEKNVRRRRSWRWSLHGDPLPDDKYLHIHIRIANRTF